MTGSKVSAALLLVAVFASGVGVGAVAARRTAENRPGREAYMERLDRQVRLNDEQRTQVQAVLDRYRPQMEALYSEQRPRYEALRQGIRTEISSLLTDEQRQRYEEMNRRHDAERTARARTRP